MYTSVKIRIEAKRKLEELRTPEKVREWLLSHGAPKIVKKLDEFF